MSESAPEKGHSAMPDLGQKVGPLPAWGWGAIVVIAYLVWRHYAAGKAQTTGAGATQPADANGVPSDALGGSGSASSGNGSSGGFTDSNGAVINQTPTNQAWAAQAIDALLASGKYTYADAVNAVDSYVLGTGSDATQQGIVNTAVGLVGKPPVPVPFVAVEAPTPTDTPTETTIPTPAPTPVTVPAAPDNSAADLMAAQKAKEAVLQDAKRQADQRNKEQRVAAAKKAYDDALHNGSSKSTIKRLYDAYWAVHNS